MKRITRYNDIVKAVMKKYKSTRDHDGKLYSKVLSVLGNNPNTMTGEELLLSMGSKSYPTFETISRCRRKMEEQYPSLRGKTYATRQGLAKEVRNEMKG